MKGVSLEDLLYAAYEKADWTKIVPKPNQAGCQQIDEIQGLVARATSRLAKIRRLATEAKAKNILAVLDGTDDPKAT